MRIEGALPSFYIDIPQTAMQGRAAPVEPQKTGSLYGPGVVVDISPEARAAYNQNIALAATGETQGIGAVEGPQECQTCKSRKYVDQSDDPSVSFQSPTRISPGQAAGAVMSHEREHVTNEQARADRDGRKVVSQTVTLSSSICPECGKVYISGGVTRTVTKNDNSEQLADIMNNPGENDAKL